jgi:predicted transcriptional regulator
MDIHLLASAIQKDDSTARAVLERLMEIGLVEAHGVKIGTTWDYFSNLVTGAGKLSLTKN